MTQRFGFAPIFGGIRKRAGQCQWVAEIIGTEISLMKEVRKMGGSGTVNFKSPITVAVAVVLRTSVS